jgi:hypothetical protein
VPPPWVGPQPGPWAAAQALLALAAVPALVELLRGHRRAAQALAALAYAPAMISAIVDAIGSERVPADRWYPLVLNGLALAALWAYRTDPAARPVRPWLLTYLAGVALLVATVPLGIAPEPAVFPLVDWAGMCAVAVVLTAIVRRATLAWRLALTLLAAAVLGLRLVTLKDYLDHMGPPERGPIAAVAAVQAFALAAVAVYLEVSRRTGGERAG